ncbi:hypothetical protein J2T15_000128 [Paenibacillus harenae]|uniref:Uncharacterized protein n=1 Tax=Paenibacillus harenae TaxID=306543 RepID=A0ABT9TUH5_PAEHA|nr:hypothetical protein [Paenibacillus harenae]
MPDKAAMATTLHRTECKRTHLHRVRDNKH